MKATATIAVLALAATAIHAQDDLAQKPAGAPEWGVRIGLTFLFPN